MILAHEASFLTTRSFKIHYIHQGSGPALILLHGGGTWLYSFRHNISALSRDFSVYALDLPGHGYTKALDSPAHFDFNHIGRALIEFMDAHQIKAAHFAGHSWGGKWAVRFADQHPERLSRLILIDSSGVNKHEHLTWEILKIPVLGEFLFKRINPHAIEKGLRESFVNKSLVTPQMIHAIYEPLRNPGNQKAQLDYLRNADWRNTRKALSRLSAPALIIWGEKDRYIHVKHGRRMDELIPHSRLVSLKNCGHSSHEECPDTVNRLIRNFLLEDQWI